MRLTKNSMVTYQSREKFTIRASGNTLRTPSTGSIWPRHKKRELTFWQTMSRSMVVHDSVPADCIEKVVSENGESTFFKDSPRLHEQFSKCLELTAAAATTAARHLGEHRDTCSGAKLRHPQQLQQGEYRDTSCGKGEFLPS